MVRRAEVRPAVVVRGKWEELEVQEEQGKLKMWMVREQQGQQMLLALGWWSAQLREKQRRSTARESEAVWEEAARTDESQVAVVEGEAERRGETSAGE